MKKIMSISFAVMILLSLSACAKHQSETTPSKHNTTSVVKASVAEKTKEDTASKLRKLTGDYWQLSSEVTNYPDLTKFTNLSIETSISQNRTYLKSNHKTLYTFYSSAGVDNTTPTGTYATQPETSATFYNATEGEGANYAVSWLDHGIYLFHSVPIDASGNYITSEAEKLGKQPGSHGCVRLSVADSHWLYQQAISGVLPVGTPVMIKP